MTATLCLTSFDLSSHSASGFIWRHIVPRMEPVSLYGPLARRVPFSIFAPASDFILGTGHGESNTYSGQNESPIWKVGEYKPSEVNGKVIKLVSCQTGKQLGPDLVDKGARCFMGYDDDLVWIVDSAYYPIPWDDPNAKLCFHPIVDSLHALLDGTTCEEAMEIERSGYINNMEATDSDFIRACLQFNHDHTILLGDPAATVKPRPRITLPPPPPLLF
jgi:hypothetical protein